MIVIDGNIGSGKSSVLLRLQEDYPQWMFIQEKFVFGNDNSDPILPKYYNNPDKYAMAVQMKILMSHMTNRSDEEMTFTERSPLSCIHVFGEMLADEGRLNEEEQGICVDINRTYGWYPHHVIYIRVAPQICHERMCCRGRDYERDGIKLSYLEALHAKYEDLYMTDKVRRISPSTVVHVIDASQDAAAVYTDVKAALRDIGVLHPH
jgi:deoxyadenosine/deoxycytidine kinase